MSKIYDRAGVASATTGTGTITLGSAIAAGTTPFACSYRTFANAGVVDGDVVSLLILDTNGAWELSTGTYTAAGTTVTRTLVASSTGALLNLSGNEQVFIVAHKSNLANLTENNLFTGAQPLSPSANDGGALGTSTLSFSDLFLASGGVINWASSDATITNSASGLLTVQGTPGSGNPVLSARNVSNSASISVAMIEGARAIPTDGDEAFIQLRLNDSGGTATEFVRLTWTGVDITDGTEDGSLTVGVITAGSLANELVLNGASLSPFASGGLALGTASLPWSEVRLAAGTTAIAPITLTAGTNMTTPAAGSIEMDANCFYGTTDAGNRGYVPVRHFIRADATRTFTSNTNEQAIFTNPTNGRLTVETGCYFFEGLIFLTAMSGTSGNITMDIVGAGTVTASAWAWQATGMDVASGATGSAVGGSWQVAAQSAGTNLITAATGTAMSVYVQGSFEVTVAGTIIPSLTMITASASVVSIGSYMSFERVGSTSVVSVGQWD